MYEWFDPVVCWKCNSYIDIRTCSACRESFCDNHRLGHEKTCWSVEKDAVNYNGSGRVANLKLIYGRKRAIQLIPKG